MASPRPVGMTDAGAPIVLRRGRGQSAVDDCVLADAVRAATNTALPANVIFMQVMV